MKAIVHHSYGPAEGLSLEEVDKPVPEPDRVLVRVRAASVNAYDWHIMRGVPYLVRMSEGMRRPRSVAMGVDLAGVVEAVGDEITEFKPGDEVLGAADGAFAEYVCAKETRLVPKPARLSFEEAAAVPMAGITALQGLRDRGEVHAGQRVVINGASGGVGTFAVQVAKALGATATGVCSRGNMDLVRSLGADHVVDYTTEDFTRQGQRLLAFLAHQDKADLVMLRELVEAGKLTPVIDRTYPLSETAEAIRYLETGHARAKVVVTL
jgi:NADPH:quinone reductase-like Zn-dependent oxidoreductase